MIMNSHAVLLVFDAAEGLVRADMAIAQLVVDHQKSCVLLANKCDLLTPAQREQVSAKVYERVVRRPKAPPTRPLSLSLSLCMALALTTRMPTARVCVPTGAVASAAPSGPHSVARFAQGPIAPAATAAPSWNARRRRAGSLS